MTDLTKPVTRRVTTARIRDFKLPALIITIATGAERASRSGRFADGVLHALLDVAVLGGAGQLLLGRGSLAGGGGADQPRPGGAAGAPL